MHGASSDSERKQSTVYCELGVARPGSRMSARSRFAVCCAGVLGLVAPLHFCSPAAHAEDVQQDGFKAVVAVDSVIDALSDFERHRKNGTWEKAFAALDEMYSSSSDRLLPSSSGFLVTVKARIYEAVTGLPPEGRKAFDVYYGAKAQQMLDGLKACDPREEVRAAEAIVDRYLLTDAGAEAANLLGDAYFENGEFLAAERAWRAVLDYHPNADYSAAKLQLKRAVALRRAGRNREFGNLAETIRNRTGDESVQIGGEDVTISGFLDQLMAEAAGVSDTAAQSRPASQTDYQKLRAPADSADPEWQVRYLSEAGKKALEGNVQNHRQGGASLDSYIPPVAIINDRMYCNWMGICFAVGMDTGKLLWRTDKFTDLTGKFDQIRNGRGVNLDQYSIAVGADRVVAVAMPLDRLNHYREPYRMVAYNAETGKKEWSSADIESLKEVDFIGEPLIHGDAIFVVSRKKQTATIELRVMTLKDGQGLWTLALGDVVGGNNPYNNSQIVPKPQCLLDSDTLYVLTNNGALISVNLREHGLDWVYSYRAPTFFNANQQNYWGRAVSLAVQLHSDGGMFLEDGVLYFKEGRGERLYAMDVINRKMIWERPVSEAATLVGHDEEFLYLLSKELVAVDRTTRALRWSIELPIRAGGLSAVVGPDRLLVNTSRGIYELSRASGDTQRIYRGGLSGGGALSMIAKRIVSVSNEAITSYPVRLEE